MALLKTLADADIAEGCEISVETLDDARKMAKLLGNAQKVAAGHRARGGSIARVVVGRLSFDRETLDAAFEDAMGTESGHLGDSDLCLGASISFPTAASGPHGDAPLCLHFAWQSGVLLVSARDDNVPSDSVEMPQDYYPISQGLLADGPTSQKPLTLDVICFSQALILNHRGVVVHKNSAWQAAASGIFAVTKGREAARKALTCGVLCIACVRDDEPEHSTGLAKTLHLDRPQRQVPKRM